LDGALEFYVGAPLDVEDGSDRHDHQQQADPHVTKQLFVQLGSLHNAKDPAHEVCKAWNSVSPQFPP
jgi:hypothetical protein